MEFLTKEVTTLGAFSLLVWHIIVAVAVIALIVVLIVVLCKAGKKKQTAQASQPTTDTVNTDDDDDDQVDEVIVTIEEDGDDDDVVDSDQPVDQQPTDTPADDNVDQPKKPRVKNYHISLRPDGRWQVKLSKGDRAIKLFKTQAEAIAFAKSRAKSQDGHITIHKVDGKIRKQKY